MTGLTEQQQQHNNSDRNHWLRWSSARWHACQQHQRIERENKDEEKEIWIKREETDEINNIYGSSIGGNFDGFLSSDLGGDYCRFATR